MAGAASGSGGRMEGGVFDGDGVALDEAGALRVADVRRGEALFDAGEWVDRVGRRSVVVALERLDELGGGTDDSDRGDVGFEREDVVLVPEQDHGFASGAEGESAVRGGVDFAEGDLAVGVAGRRVEHAELE